MRRIGAIVFVAAGPESGVGAVVLVVTAGARLSQYVGATVGELGFLRGIWLDSSRRLTWLEDYAASKARVADVMDRCLIADVQHRLIGKLSKGYRQRVGLAQAIVDDAAVLLLDEPTIGLDPRQIAEIRTLIKALAGEHTVILSTHILPEVSMVCSGVVIINKGAIVAQGPIDTLVEQFFPTARVEVEIAGPPGAVRDGMRTIPGVVQVTPQPSGDGIGRYVVESARGRDVRAEIFQLAAQQKWELRELRRVGMTLEEVFIRIVAGEETEEPAPAAPEETEMSEPRA
jgi:ABC-2 type transport system ATP-binding protein